MFDPNDEFDVSREPAIRGGGELDPSEQLAADRLRRERESVSEDDPPDDSVWDEPALSPELAGPAPAGKRSYGTWLAQRQQRVSGIKSWMVTLLIVCAAGPWSVLASFIRESTSGTGGIIMIVVFAPVIEELMKVSLPLMVVETRPYLFVSRFQILLAAIAGGMVFGALENLLYLNVYIAEPTFQIRMIRWLACFPGHTIWSLIAGIGVARMWEHCMRAKKRPDMTLAAPWLIAAMVLHGAFNAIAVILSLTKML